MHPAAVGSSRRPTSPPTPSWSAGTSGRRAWPAAASATWSTPGWSPGTSLGDRRQRARPARASTWSPAATSPLPARSRRPRCAPATRARRCGGPLTIARGIEIGHVFQLGRTVRRRVRAGRARPGREAGPADHGLVRDRGVPGGRGDRRAAPRRARAGLAARRSRPYDVHVVRGRQAATSRRTRGTWPSGWPTPGCECSSTTGRRRPGSSSPTPS